MALTTKRNDGWDRRTVKWEHPELRNLSKAFSRIKDQASIQTPTVAGEQGLIHIELIVLLRWEDDGGQTT